ncbi:MAG TPA: hypothetical protein VD932_05320 [Aquabacterium sp.]|nr:hypothetical protein [Aquabacterium sp.]
MSHRDPVRSLRCALQCALKQDLLNVDLDRVGGAGGRRCSGRRPREDECDVVLFVQSWTDEALGHAGAEGARPFEQDTTVVVGPAQDACVYVGAELLYHVIHPNRRFFLDVAAHCMAPKADGGVYEGRDDPVTESVDIEVGAMLARLHAQVRAGEPQRALLVARYLHRCAVRLEAPLRSPTPPQRAPAGIGSRRH